MDDKLASLIQVAALSKPSNLAAELLRLLTGSIQLMNVRKAKSELSEVLNQTRNGAVQLISKGNEKSLEAKDVAVVVSMETLAEIVFRSGQPTFGEAMKLMGVRPAYGAKIAQRKIHPRDASPLTRGREKLRAG